MVYFHPSFCEMFGLSSISFSGHEWGAIIFYDNLEFPTFIII